MLCSNTSTLNMTRPQASLKYDVCFVKIQFTMVENYYCTIILPIDTYTNKHYSILQNRKVRSKIR